MTSEDDRAVEEEFAQMFEVRLTDSLLERTVIMVRCWWRFLILLSLQDEELELPAAPTDEIAIGESGDRIPTEKGTKSLYTNRSFGTRCRHIYVTFSQESWHRRQTRAAASSCVLSLHSFVFLAVRNSAWCRDFPASQFAWFPGSATSYRCWYIRRLKRRIPVTRLPRLEHCTAYGGSYLNKWLCKRFLHFTCLTVLQVSVMCCGLLRMFS